MFVNEMKESMFVCMYVCMVGGWLAVLHKHATNLSFKGNLSRLRLFETCFFGFFDTESFRNYKFSKAMRMKLFEIRKNFRD